MDISVLFLGFNRPESSRRVFEVIKLVKPKYLYVAVDGPRKNKLQDSIQIKAVIQIFGDVDWDCNVQYLIREENLGCGLAVSSAIDWFFNNVEEGIILEDDCLPSLEFFAFCSEMLSLYRNNSRIIGINGYNPINGDQISESYTFISYNLIWGWASWRRSWRLYKYNLQSTSNFLIFYNLIKKFKFDFISIRSWLKHLALVKKQVIDTWDYQWIYTAFATNSLVVLPKYNLIQNIGNFDDPTHGTVNADFMNISIDSRSVFPLIIPGKIEINKNYDNSIKINRFGNSFKKFWKAKKKKIWNQLKGK